MRVFCSVSVTAMPSALKTFLLLELLDYNYIKSESMDRQNPGSSKTTELVMPIKVNSQSMVFSNKVFLSNQSSFALLPASQRYLVFKGYILSYDISDQIPKGKIGLSSKFREFLTADLVHEVYIQSYNRRPEDKYADSLLLKVELFIPPKERMEVDDLGLAEDFLIKNQDRYLAIDQAFMHEYRKIPYVLTIQKVLGGEHPFLALNTKISCIGSGEQNLRLASAKMEHKNIFAEGFTIDSLGIGGLNSELTNIFRRAFASRRLPLSIIDKFGINHVKGILLYGPPGTGKTLIARQLAKSLKAKSLQVINGPEVFSKFVGESAENVRKLFQPARDDEKKYGDESPLHVIVFDEIDAICRQRGSDSGGTTAKDDVVNQLLTNLDGVESLNNIVVIGMTNRKDLIDEAVLRPGRLELHVEIGLPDEQGRKQILEIHTKQLKSQKLLDERVDLGELAKITKNYTGAELEAVVKNASSYAMLKGNDIMDFSRKMKLEKNVKVTPNDFYKAIDQVVPGFGIDQEHFEILSRNILINYGPRFERIWNILDKTANLATKGQSHVASIMLYGAIGNGKTSIAAEFAKKSPFSYIKLLTSDRYIGVSPQGKINGMTKIFNDAYKSTSALIVIDSIERLIQFVGGVPDFNNHILQSLLTLIQKIPTNPDCRLLIIGTSSNFSAMQLLDIDKVFNLKLKIPLLNEVECAKVVGKNIGICDQPIRKLVQFKDTLENVPQSQWKSKWELNM